MLADKQNKKPERVASSSASLAIFSGLFCGDGRSRIFSRDAFTIGDVDNKGEISLSKRKRFCSNPLISLLV